MSEFLVEIYTSREAAELALTHVEDVSRAADQVSENGTGVRLLRAILVPEEETCFYLYQSSSVDAVREAATRAGLRFERITEAVSSGTT
jgi:hypothetical protein